MRLGTDGVYDHTDALYHVHVLDGLLGFADEEYRGHNRPGRKPRAFCYGWT